MSMPVTVCAERDQIRFIIVSRMTSKLEVMDFERLHGAASLASPTVALQYLAM